MAHDVIGRLMIQSARTPAMSLIMAELSSFSGVEIYFKEWPGMFQLQGRRCSKTNHPGLNPPPDPNNRTCGHAL